MIQSERNEMRERERRSVLPIDRPRRLYWLGEVLVEELNRRFYPCRVPRRSTRNSNLLLKLYFVGVARGLNSLVRDGACFRQCFLSHRLIYWSIFYCLQGRLSEYCFLYSFFYIHVSILYSFFEIFNLLAGKININFSFEKQ